MPEWIRTRFPQATHLAEVRRNMYSQGLATVCKEARCPNQGECASRGTATFLILGQICTRNCSFCAVKHGKPSAVDLEEPARIGAAVARMKLKHAVITSVTRDDLEDGGASVFAETIRQIRQVSPGTTIEVLIPDFRGCNHSLDLVIKASPDVITHNIETVPRLYPQLRQGASYSRSIELLRSIRKAGDLPTKSGIMVGVGETVEEIMEVVEDLVNVGCVALTIGQYLQPTAQHHPVVRFVPPNEFDRLRAMALAKGMKHVSSGPLVRSSYNAGEVFQKLNIQNAHRKS